MIETTRRSLLGGMAVLGAAAAIPAIAGTGHTDEVVPLWPNKPPGSPAQLPARRVEERSSDPSFHDR